MRWLTKRSFWLRVVPLAMILAVSAVLAFQVHAQAHVSPGPVHGIISSDAGDLALARGDGPVVLTATDRAVLAMKWHLAQEYAQMQAGTLAPATFARDWQHFMTLYGTNSGHTMQVPSITPCPLTPTKPLQKPCVYLHLWLFRPCSRPVF